MSSNGMTYQPTLGVGLLGVEVSASDRPLERLEKEKIASHEVPQSVIPMKIAREAEPQPL
jgi:hypothetical protein